MTASMRLMHEGCGSGHITVGGADDDLRKALTSARGHSAQGLRECSRALHRSITSRYELEDPKQVRSGTTQACY